MRRIAYTALATAALFLSLMAILIDAPALFFMSFALVALLIACNVQSYLSARALKIDRIVPKSVRVNELVTIELVIWSLRKLKRPLVTVQDNVPQRLTRGGVGLSLPIAPAYDLPVRTMYKFQPRKRGRFSWKNITVTATDALGLTTRSVKYETEPTEITVLPVPIPVAIELPSSAGWGINEAASGQAAGAGIEPRGVREYASGDSLRHVHWRSSARMGRLMVKEFQAGAHGACSFVLQRTSGTDRGEGDVSTLDVMCGHVLFLSDQLIRMGVSVSFPTLESNVKSGVDHDRVEAVAALLGEIQASSQEPIGVELERVLDEAESGSVIFVCAAVDDDSLTSVIARHRGNHTIVPLVYEPKLYDPKFTGRSMAAPEALERLRSAGSNPTLMPEFLQ